MNLSISEKRAIVTGATRGIGRAVVEQMLELGINVVGIGSKPGGNVPNGCDYFAADFSDTESVSQLCSFVSEWRPDILVNNAGINKISPFTEINLADFEEIQLINVTVPFRLCQAALPYMKKSGWGRIVNIGSVWGKVGKGLRASYSTSKFALDGMTSALAAELTEFGVLANCVSPGIVETEMTRSALNVDQLDELLSQVPAKRLASPDEIARLVCWLSGPENTFISGQNIAIDGGLTRV